MKKCLAIFFLFFSIQHVLGQPPIVSSFTPLSGPSGTIVTITGNNFSTTAANNIVYFGAVRANVMNATTNSLTVTVPAVTTYDFITVTTNNLTAYSTQPFIITFPGGGPFSANSFASKNDFAAGSEAFAICTSDLDGDGKSDLAVANRAGNSLSVLRNTSTIGSISFDPKIDLATGTGSHHVVAGDLDGDGKHDLAVVNDVSATISVFRNTSSPGLISFAPKLDIATGAGPDQMVIGDLDADGKPDIAVANGSSNSFSAFRNTSTPGSISFAAKIDFMTMFNVNGMSIGDLNTDGKPDLATANVFSNNISVFGNTSTTGAISFASGINYTTGYGPQNVRIGDLDMDGKPDLTVGSNQTIQVFRNNGTGTTISFAPVITLMPTGGHQVCLGDLNGDGLPDIGSNRATFNIFSVLRNTSSPGIISFSHEGNFQTGFAPVDMVPVDIDGDSKPDLATANFSGSISVRRNRVNEPNIISFNPVGGCTVAGSTVLINGNKFMGATAVSFGGIPATSFTVNSDISISAQVAGTISGTVSVTTPNGTGILNYPLPAITSFTPTTASPGSTITITGNYFCGATSVTIGGLAATSFTVNSDQQITATVGGTVSGDVTVTSPYGMASLAGFYNGPTISSFTPESGIFGSTVTITGTNFNNTPSGNIVYFGATQAGVTTGNSTSLTVTVPVGATHQPITVTTSNFTAYSNKPFLITFPGNTPIAPNSFMPKVDFGTANIPARICVSDIDGDGKSDLVNTNFNSNSVSVLRNTSITGSITSASFAPKLDIATANSPEGLAVGDLNGDGKPDLAVICNNSTVRIHRNTSTTGAISFAAGTDYPAESVSTAVSIGDLDGDGKPDLVITSDSSANVSILRNTGINGSISFDDSSYYFMGDISSDLFIVDLNQDGKPDIAVTSPNLGVVSVFRNTSTAGIISFAAKIDFPTGTNPSGLSSGDFDGDGKPDLAITNKGANSISILRNTSAGATISFAAKIDLTAGTGPYSPSVADLDGDNKPDLAIANSVSTTISLYSNTSVSGTISFSPKIDYSTGTFPFSVASGDLDGDGKTDLAVTNQQGNSISVFRNRNGDPQRVQLCPGGSTSISSDITGVSYQWQLDTGTGFSNISDNSNYSGTNMVNLQLNNLPSSWYGYKYRCVVNGNNSTIFSLVFENNWTGTIDAAWENPLNWSCGTVPDVNTDVIILSGNVILNSNTTIRSLVLSPGASLTIVSGFTLTITH